MPEAQLRNVFDDQVKQVTGWMATRPNMKAIEVVYHELVAAPATQAQRLNAFLGGELDVGAMVAAVDPRLYRNRA
jgi:hypothetical protein